MSEENEWQSNRAKFTVQFHLYVFFVCAQLVTVYKVVSAPSPVMWVSIGYNGVGCSFRSLCFPFPKPFRHFGSA
jgi:hypothetical protein